MNESDSAVISAATQKWADAFNSGDAATIANMMSANGRLFPPNGETVEGREAIQAFWKGFIDTGAKGALEETEIAVSGDLAYKTGNFQILDPNGNELDHGTYLEVWSRIDGTWQFHRDMWNSSVPAPE